MDIWAPVLRDPQAVGGRGSAPTARSWGHLPGPERLSERSRRQPDKRALCSSPDGIKWDETPADPAIAAAPGRAAVSSLFDRPPRRHLRCDRHADRPGLQTATPTPILAPSDGSMTEAGQAYTLWRGGSNGVNWGQVDSPQFAGLSLTTVTEPRKNGFILVAANSPEETGWALTSPDGATWTRSSRSSAMPGMSGRRRTTCTRSRRGRRQKSGPPPTA